MDRLVLYVRQIFTEDFNLTLFGTGTLLTIFCWTIGIFFWGMDLLLLPLMLGIILLGLSGPVIIIQYLMRKNRGGQKIKILGRLKNLTLGTYLGFFLLNPIDNWDNQQRQKSGKIISESLENYKKSKGIYPTDLAKIKNELSNLPVTYPWDKFNYRTVNDSYDLDIPISIMDRWHWDNKKNVFIYDDW